MDDIWAFIGRIRGFPFRSIGPSSLFSKVSSDTVEKSATSMNESVIQGLDIQKKALQEGNYLPIYGSSAFPVLTHFILA